MEKIQKISDPTIRATLLCESGDKQYKDDGSILRGKAGEYGVGQFMKSTWDVWNKQRGTTLDIMNEDDELDMIQWAFAHGLQNHWTCYRDLPSKEG